MKAATGLLLVGGGAFILISLFNGTISFPLGSFSFNPLGDFTKSFQANKVTGQTGVTPTGAGYFVSSSQGSQTSQEQICRTGGGVWVNGQCRHFTGAGANK